MSAPLGYDTIDSGGVGDGQSGATQEDMRRLVGHNPLPPSAQVAADMWVVATCRYILYLLKMLPPSHILVYTVSDLRSGSPKPHMYIHTVTM